MKIHITYLTIFIKIVGINMVNMWLYGNLVNLIRILIEFPFAFTIDGTSSLYWFTVPGALKVKFPPFSSINFPSVPSGSTSM